MRGWGVGGNPRTCRPTRAVDRAQVAAAQPLHGDEALRAAATLFQASACAFAALAALVQQRFHPPPTGDLQPALLLALSALMLAQAQETLWRKTVAERKVKDAVVAKVLSV